MTAYTAYVGTLTRFSRSRGVHVLDVRDGGRTLVLRDVHDAADPTWVVTSPDGTTLHAAGHRSFVGDLPGAPLTSWPIRPDGSLGDPSTRQLPFTHASHISFDRSGRWMFVACTLGGGFVVLPLGDDGVPGTPTAVMAHAGPAMVPLGTSEVPPVIPAPGSPMPHAVIADPGNRLLVVADMGLDLLASYRFDPTAGSVEPLDVVKMPPGAEGPRHGAFLDGGDILLVVNELGSSLSTVAFDASTGTGEVLSTSAIEPTGGTNKPSGVVLDRARGLAHVANRGRDDITTFSVGRDGDPELVAVADGHGHEPRGIACSPDATHLFLGHEHSHQVTVHALRPDGLVGELVAATDVQGATAIAFGPGGPAPTAPATPHRDGDRDHGPAT